MYRLERELDRGLVSGDVSDLSYYDQNTSQIIIENNSRPRVNTYIKVGSSNWWNSGQENCWAFFVKEILFEDTNQVQFKSENGITYTWFIEN